jgi:SAM-dependent methyltransferase
MGNDRQVGADVVSQRSGSFGAVATEYERFRPGPPVGAIAWLLPLARTVVDLGAGTGAMTRDLVEMVDHVIAIEPDDRMRAILAASLPGVVAVKGTGEAMPVTSSTVDAVLASSSWHWMDPDRALDEVARVLVPGGTLGVVWSGPDPDGPFISQAQVMLSEMASDGPGAGAAADGAGDLGNVVMDTDNRVEPVLRIPGGSPFAQPECRSWVWDVALTADDLIGLLGTFSWIITMPDDRRAHVISEARRILREGLGIAGDVTVDVRYRSEAWRTRLL